MLKYLIVHPEFRVPC